MEITVNGTITLTADEALLKVLDKLTPKEEVLNSLQKPATAAIKAPTPVVAAYYSTPITDARPTPAPCTASVPVATVPIQTVPTAAPATLSSPAVPTAAPTYQIEDLARASAQLMDAGKQPQLLALLQQFKVQGLSQLQPGQFGAFATALRGMGAKI